MRPLLLVLALLANPSSARGSGIPAQERAGEVHEIKLGKGTMVQTSLSPADVVVNFFLLPLAYAYALPHYGFTRYPYETQEGYGRGEREMAVTFYTSRQLIEKGRQAQHAHLRVRGDNRLGWDFGLSSYDPRVFRPQRRGVLYAGHVTANYLQTGSAFLEAGLGAASFQDPEPRSGFSGELALTLFPKLPYTLSIRYQGASLHGRGYHDLSAIAGISWRWLGLAAGYRAFLNPFKDLAGPEMSLLLWF